MGTEQGVDMLQTFDFGSIEEMDPSVGELCPLLLYTTGIPYDTGTYMRTVRICEEVGDSHGCPTLVP